MAADLQSHFQYWKEFNLSGLQRELDITANDLAARQDESDNSRKKLVEQSREFKRVTPEEIRKQVAPLLKSFQVEIDSLSKRSKAAEAAFLTIYKRLIDVPDPLAAFELSLSHQKSVTRLSDIEIENSKLRETLAEYNNEFAEVKNQELTIKQLKEKIKEYEQRIDTEVQSRSAGQEKELNRQYQEKEKQLHETQLSFAKRLGQAQQEINMLRTALEASQSELFEMKSKHEQTSAAKSDEMEMMIADLERANERASLAERQVETMRDQMTKLQGSLKERDNSNQQLDMAIDQMKRSNLELELTAKEKEVAQLVEEVQKLQSALSKQQVDFMSRINKLEEDLTRKDEEITTLNKTLSKQSDYEEICKELQILKSVEFSNTAEQTSGSDNDAPKSLETLLLEKNRSLQNENTQLKNSNSEVTEGGSVKIEPVDISVTSPTLLGSPTSVSHSVSHSCTASSTDSSMNGGGHHTLGGENGLSTTTAWSPPNTMYLTHPEFLKETLDTLDVSNKVKELLSVHNIGQRVFAKQVLGLSQGTVSELLSKPKHWDKLTEKGRESYRKMYYWLQDIRNIDSLKNASPRKPPGPFSMSKQDSVNAEERIAQILREAQNAMIHKNHGDQLQSTYRSQSSHQQHNNNNNSKYQTSAAATALTDKADQRGERRQSNSSNHTVTTSSAATALLSQHQQSGSCESSEAIVSRIYEEELSKLAEQAKQSGNITEYQLYQTELQRILMKKASHSPSMSSVNSYAAGGDLQDQPQDLSISHHTQSGDGRSESNGSAVNGGSAVKQEQGYKSTSRGGSPLQQMQNITNQFLSSTQAHLLQQKPLKHVLPPISQDQFDKYTGLNTEDLVRKVKELLSQFSISQRLFGENVLGLSQGSVSDLLARPKPWSMLTQKGREPFIRMKIFSEDPEAVKRLMSNQYKANLPLSSESVRDSPSVPAVSDTPPAVERCQSSDVSMDWIPTMVPNPLSMNMNMVQAPSIIELVAATGELDTLFVTSRVKEMLQFHNIGQKLFGEAVLGLSQGSVSDMLSKPKPWHLLSLKGREPFVRMHLWLTDPMNILRLKSYQAEVKAFRRRSGSCGTVHEDDRSSPFYTKKPRYSFTDEQKNMLREAFNHDPYPTSAAIEALAMKMQLSAKTVINWFHNHRMRSKQQNRDENGKCLNGVVIKQEPDTASLDGVQFSSQNSYTTDSQHSSPDPSGDAAMSPPSSSAVDRSQATQQNNISSSVGSASLTHTSICNNITRKRKSANPARYVSAGAQLDKHNTADDEDEIDVTGLSEADLKPGAEEESASVPESVPKSAVEEGEGLERQCKIARLEASTQKSDLQWEEEKVVDRSDCLQKLESRVNNDSNSADEWEF